MQPMPETDDDTDDEKRLDEAMPDTTEADHPSP